MTFLPIVVRELRVAARRRATHWVRVGAALAGLALASLIIGSARSSIRPYELGQIIFLWEGMGAFGICLFSGVFLTADCLSEERREGTMGLLFLTDLKGYDVVLGKLVSTSIQCVFALLAVFPMMALPLLMGGTTGSEFLRLVLTLLTTLMFSLSVGMAVSSVANDSRQTFAATLGVILFMAAVVPVAGSLISWLLRDRDIQVMALLLSPVGGFMLTFDALRWGAPARAFPVSLAINWLVAILALVFAGWMVRLRLQDSEFGRDKQTARAARQHIRRAFSMRLIRRHLEVNPFLWLALRDHASRWVVWAPLWLVLVVWFVAVVTSSTVNQRGPKEMALVIGLLASYGMHLVVKTAIAIEATRRFSTDRQNGALELLLGTPMTPGMIMAAQWRAMCQRFTLVCSLAVAVNVVMLWIILVPNPGRMPGEVRGVFSTMLVGGAGLSFFDFRLLVWSGMRQALTRKRHHWAVLATLIITILPTGVGVLLLFLIALGGGGISEEAMQALILIWILGSGFYAILGTAMFKEGLTDEFRGLVHGDDRQLRQTQSRPDFLMTVENE